MRPSPCRRSLLAIALLAATVCTVSACGRPTPAAGSLAGASVVDQSPLPLPTLPSAIPAAGTRLTLPTVDLILEPPTGVDRARLAVPGAAKAFAIDRAYSDPPDFPTLADIVRAALANIDPMPRSTAVLAFVTVQPLGFPLVDHRLCWVLRDEYVEWDTVQYGGGTPPPWPYPPIAEADISLIDARTGRLLCDFDSGGGVDGASARLRHPDNDRRRSVRRAAANRQPSNRPPPTAVAATTHTVCR